VDQGFWRAGGAVIALALAAALARAQCPEFSGALEQGGFIWGKVAPGSAVRLGPQKLDVLPGVCRSSITITI
jgi:hypothetical protein